MCRERRDVVAAFTQRWDFNRKDARAIEEIPAEAAVIDLLLHPNAVAIT